MKRLSTGAILVLAALLVGAIAVACSDNDAKGESSASQASIEQLATRVQRNEILNAVIVISGLPEHDMDSAAQSGKIDNKYVPTARMIVRLSALTDWTPDLADGAKRMHDECLALLQGLDAGKDVEAIKPLSQGCHEEWHMFTDDAWESVAKELPTGAGGPRATATPGGATTPTSHDMSTPAAGGTMTMPPHGSEMQ